MAIIRNIPTGITLLASLRQLTKLQKEIDAARAAGENERERAAILKATKTWGDYLMKRFKVDILVEGRENLPTEGPVIYMANHQSYTDIPVLCSVLDTVQFGFIAKEVLSKLPLYGQWMKRIRGVMIKREAPRAALQAISTGVDYVNDGFSMAIFPEGTRGHGRPMAAFKPGAIKLATKPGVPIVPISLQGTYQIYEKHGYLKKGCKVCIIIHPPIETKDLPRKEEKALSDRVERTIAEGVDRLCRVMDMPPEPPLATGESESPVEKDGAAPSE